MSKVIHYGLGKEYLPDWGIQQALREIYQNFLDYDTGTYQEIIKDTNAGVFVSISNDWIPESLDFLRIGNSKKTNPQSIGKHGEGLKMAFLILERLGYKSRIFTNKYVIYPSFYKDDEIGECFCLIYTEHNIKNKKYTVEFNCPKNEYNLFRDNLIEKKDILFSHYYGDVVDKPIGNIYSGGLFVTHIKEDMSNAYNIKPEYLPLDRDRSVPHSFDVNFHSSHIFAAYGKMTVKDLSHNDTMYVSTVPNSIKEKVEPKIIGNTIEFVTKNEEGEDVVIKNENVKNILKSDSIFTVALKKLRMFIAKQLGLYDLLLEFKKKHVHGSEALADFELILERVEK